MSDKSKIEWTDATWNPVTGCDKVSPGCDHCYAETIAHRFAGTAAYPDGFAVTLHPDRLDQPLRWRRPRLVFVNSMSDLFHKDIPDEYIARVFAVMSLAPQHTFQVLTKRHGRMRSLLSSPRFLCMVEDAIPGIVAAHKPARVWYGAWPLPNVWLGVSVEDQQRADLRIPALLDTPAAVRFLSCDPLLGPVDLTRYVDPERDCSCSVPAMEGAGQHSTACRCLTQPDLGWVIVGGESGPGARPMHPEWARSLRDRCQDAGIPFHFKQWGEWAPAGYQDGTHLLQLTGQLVDRKSATTAPPRLGARGHDLVDRGHPGWVRVRRPGKRYAGRELDGHTWDEMPAVAS